MKQSLFLFILCVVLVPFLLGVSPFVRHDGEPQVQGPLSVYNGFNLKTGVCTLSDDLIVDGGEIGLTGDLNLLKLAIDALTINGGITQSAGTLATGNETSPDTDAGGICLNTGTSTGDVLTMKNDWVSHGITDYAETDTHLQIRKHSGSDGGAIIRGLTDTATGIQLWGVVTTTVGTEAPVSINSSKKAGVTGAAMADNENIFLLQNHTTTKIKVLGNGDTEFEGDLIVDGGKIGVTGDLDLLQLSNGDLDVNGTSEFVGDMTLPATNPAGDTYSYEIILQAHNTASPGDETQVSKLFTAPDPGGGFGAYLVIAAPDASGAAANVFAIKHDLFGFATDDYVDIGSTGANRPKDIFLAGNLDAEVGSITAQTGLTTDTGDITATTGAILAGTTVTATGDLIINGGEIGLSTDLDLFQIDVDEVTINGDVAITGEMSATTITASTGDVTAGNDLLGRFAAYDVIPIEWCHDGSVPPAAAAEITSGNGAVQAREFGGPAGNTVQDVVCPWYVPADIVAGSGIKFMVTSVVPSVDTIANQGVSYKLSGDCVGDNDPLAVAFGVEVESKMTGVTAAQNDVLHTPFSGVVTVDDLAAGEMAQLHFKRDTADADDDYDEPIGVIYIVIKYEKLTAGF